MAVRKRHPSEDLWHPRPAASRLMVIEPSKEDTEPDPAAVPFGFSQALEEVRESGLILTACVDLEDRGDDGC